MAEKMHTKFPVGIEYEPKLDYRFLVEFPEEFNLESFMVQKITNPNLREDKWDNIEITLLDLISPSTSRAVMNMVDICSKVKSGLFSKKTLFILHIKALDPTGVEVEEWSCDIEKILLVDFGSFSHSGDDLKLIKIVLKPSNCRLK